MSQWSDKQPLMPGQQGGPSPQAPPPAYSQPQAPPPMNPSYAGGYPPAQPPQVGAQHSNTTVVVAPVHQPAVTMMNFKDQPVRVRCPNCQNDILTQLDFTPGALTWLVVIILFFFGFWLCFFIPLCIDDLKDVNHTCPVCNYQVGSYKRL